MNVYRTITMLLTALALSAAQGACVSKKEESMARPDTTQYEFTNHLINESSPYLLSHAHNPVDWYPWGDEALERAHRENKPIFLSIGYSACHWCHVMERESFENETVAAVLNDNFISIKVDREQRPDLDRIYMAFTTAMTGRGGWPMSVWLTPDLKPFYAGTYFPAVPSYGRPSFLQLINEIARVYREDRNRISEQSTLLFRQVEARINTSLTPSDLHIDMMEQAVGSLRANFDEQYGGFGDQPKFPHAVELELFLRYFHRTGDSSYMTMVEQALKAMADGGIFDHLGGGFARYSTDRWWLVPHFEKMLYDNSLLVSTYTEAYRITHDERYLDVIRRTLDWMLDEMTDETGGIYSSLDADSDGEEGKFYLWRPDEIETVLGVDDAKLFNAYYNVTRGGNFEGRNILNVNGNSYRVRDESGHDDFDRFLKDCRTRLLAARATRVRPLTDDKILTSWNGLALSALCRGYQVTGDKRYLDAAVNNAVFVRSQLFRKGKLTHTFRKGQRTEGEFLEDYSYYTEGLLHLFETASDDNLRWLEFARILGSRAVELFMDDDGVCYLRPESANDLIVRPVSDLDESTPSPASVLALALLKLNRLTDERAFLEAGEKILHALSGRMKTQSSGMASAMIALDYFLSDKIEIVLVGGGSEYDKMLKSLFMSYIPNRLIAHVADADKRTLPLFEGRISNDGRAQAYVCRNSVCNLPVSSAEELKAQIGNL